MISYVQQCFWDLNKGVYCQGNVDFLIVSGSVKGNAAGRSEIGIPLDRHAILMLFEDSAHLLVIPLSGSHKGV